MAISNIEIWAVIPAAGIGSRMQAAIPKQYLPLLGSTVLDISLSKILCALPLAGVVVSLNSHDTWWQYSRFASHPKVFTCAGGKERADSVLNALSSIATLSSAAPSQQAWVLVHDAVRPCVESARIAGLVKACIDLGIGGILATPVADTLKKLNSCKRIVDTLDREHVWQAHTPQFFPYRQLRHALEYCLLKQLPVTDEASAIEQKGAEVRVHADRRDNIKITLPEDLPWAEYILQQQKFSAELKCV
ncbi:MAG: 2-C-methyl-D-erythritol 4-phosphate cytidylyltransferase [Cellvibrionaceae bacterium]|nr:2-C-methyl-D-erythritol 4-phosphate cytidylyltransferase [Cellvibrionaceae bacterium]